MNENSAQIIDFLAARDERRHQQRRAELARARDAGGFPPPYFAAGLGGQFCTPFTAAFPAHFSAPLPAFFRGYGAFRPLALGAGVYRPAAQYTCNPAYPSFRRLG